MQFSKFSFFSIFLNWLYSSEQKPGNTGNFEIFEKLYCLFQVLRDFIYICQKSIFSSLNIKKGLNKLMFPNYWSTWLSLFTTKSLSKCNILEFFQPNYQFRPMKIAPAHLFATETRFCKFFAVSVFSNWLYNS